MGKTNSKACHEAPSEPEGQLEYLRRTKLSAGGQQRRLAIMKEIEMLQSVLEHMNTYETQKLSLMKLVNDAAENIAVMKETEDQLGAIEDGPSELAPFLKSLKDSRACWTAMEPTIQQFTELANAIFEKEMGIQNFSSDELATEAVACGVQLDTLKSLGSDLLDRSEEMAKIRTDMQRHFEKLASSLKQTWWDLQCERWCLIGKAILAAIGVGLTLGVLVFVFYKLNSEGRDRMGNVLVQEVPGLNQHVKDATKAFASDLRMVKAELRSIRDLQEKAKKAGSLKMPVAEMVQVMEKIVSEATRSHQQLQSRLAERQKMIELEREVEQLREREMKMREDFERLRAERS